MLEKSRCLEIGCGSGVSSLWLAKNGRNVVALDYTRESINLVKKAAEKLDIKIDICCHDATMELPFKNGEFDYIFQCGLLEHFDTKIQIKLLRNWGRYGKNMISMIPNSVSLPYMIGKAIMERSGTWEYGLETPQNSLNQEFWKAGFTEIKE
ncbi:MAG: class I SAM-dependent methyltransferase [Lachnospiraceae bacterium]|nr:class I SAM-dependent methyltransferase [Lachnospiraceae bacterium]